MKKGAIKSSEATQADQGTSGHAFHKQFTVLVWRSQADGDDSYVSDT